MSNFTYTNGIALLEQTIVDAANLILIRSGKRRKIVTEDYVLFDKNYYKETYGIDEVEVEPNESKD